MVFGGEKKKHKTQNPHNYGNYGEPGSDLPRGRWHIPGSHRRSGRAAPCPPSGMDPAVPKATLKVLGLCAALLVLVAAVTVAVAVMVWRSEAVGKLRGCRERAANESRELGNRLAELERERARLQRAAAAGERAEDALRRELAQARGDGKKLNASLASCRERAVGAGGDGGDEVGRGGPGREQGGGFWGCPVAKTRAMLHPWGDFERGPGKPQR